MNNSIDKPELETLDYKPEQKSGLICLKCDKTFPLYMQAEFAGHIALCSYSKPEQPKKHPRLCNCVDCMPASIEKQFEQPIEQLPGREHAKECECGHCPEQPNTNAILIKTIQQYMHVTTNALEKLREGITDQVPGDSCRKVRVLQALEDMDLFERTTLKELKQAFND